MTEAVSTQRNKIHPHKFTLWIALASIIMMFAGLTSAYIVKSNQPGWTNFVMPQLFWYSTAVMIVSSLTMQLSLNAFKARNKIKYKQLITITAILGISFIVLQYKGFSQLWQTGVQLKGAGAAQFMYIVFGLHALHVLGGVIALAIMFARAYSNKIRNYSSVPVEVASTYWHFVDVLWLYLFLFFVWMQ
jgi:cytochrome c oxidase subunit III